MFIQEHKSQSIITRMLEKQGHAFGKFDQGLGLFLQSQSGKVIFEHDGQVQGSIARFKGFADHANGFVIMANSEANGWYLIEEIGNNIADAFEWSEFSPCYKEVTISTIDPSIYGRYKHQETRVESLF